MAAQPRYAERRVTRAAVTWTGEQAEYTWQGQCAHQIEPCAWRTHELFVRLALSAICSPPRQPPPRPSSHSPEPCLKKTNYRSALSPPPPNVNGSSSAASNGLSVSVVAVRVAVRVAVLPARPRPLRPHRRRHPVVSLAPLGPPARPPPQSTSLRSSLFALSALPIAVGPPLTNIVPVYLPPVYQHLPHRMTPSASASSWTMSSSPDMPWLAF